jgi:Transposase DDE domain group 1
MQTECTPKLFEFEAVDRRSVVAGFDGGNITSNAGALLLGQVDQGIGLVRRFAACFIDRRDPRYVEHQVETLVGQRIFGLALGYEDLNDHDELRKDPTLAVLAGKLSPVLRTDCEPLAGKSTLNRLEHTPRRHASKYHKIDCDGAQVDALLVDLFLEAHERAPRERISTTPIFRCTANRKVAFSTVIMMNTVTYRSTCSAAGTCCWPVSGVRMSRAVTASSRRWRALSPRSANAGRACASFFAPTAASPTTS